MYGAVGAGRKEWGKKENIFINLVVDVKRSAGPSGMGTGSQRYLTSIYEALAEKEHDF